MFDNEEMSQEINFSKYISSICTLDVRRVKYKDQDRAAHMRQMTLSMMAPLFENVILHDKTNNVEDIQIKSNQKNNTKTIKASDINEMSEFNENVFDYSPGFCPVHSQESLISRNSYPTGN